MRALVLAACLLTLGCAKPAPRPDPAIPGKTLNIERLDNGCVAVGPDADAHPPQIICGAATPSVTE